MRQIVETLGLEPPFESNYKRKVHISTMTSYNGSFPFPLISPPQSLDNVLAEWLGKLSIPQCHIAETEKYAHVTFFFNGGTEKAFNMEERRLVASPKVATYDLKPEMSAAEVADSVCEALQTGFPFVMCNFAPPDMVGHTGHYEATIKAVETTGNLFVQLKDFNIGRIYEKCKELGYILMVTSDHGNAEKMFDDHGKPFTAHTTNKGFE